MIRIWLRTPASALLAAACFAFTCNSASAQTSGAGKLRPRITAPIENSNRVTLAGSRSPLALPANDVGAVPTGTKLQGITLVFSRTPAQQIALDTLIEAQQTPGSPLYHQWLTPDQFAAEFGVADSDIATVQSWLQLQGFAIDSVSRSRNRITFSGTAGLVASAFGAPLHYFKSSSASGAAETHFAPASDLTLPAALSSSVMAITNLSNFRPHPHIKFRGPQGERPAFTSSQTGSHYLTPGDIATIYDITPAYNAGFTGSNQSIAVVGQSDVDLSDIAAFQAAVNITTAKAPILVLVPATGTPLIRTGDEAESDLDLEYSSTIAKGAQVYFVYTGSSTTEDVFNALIYAVDERISPIISVSYGDCETDLGASNFATLNQSLDQAAAQGQTVVSASGDSGSTDCYGDTNLTTAEQEALVTDFPASSQYVTAIGGTEFPAADVAVGDNTYFAAQTTTDTISSALSYIPEMAWNDDATFAASDPTSPIGAGGGGVSIFAPRPTWQNKTIGGVVIPTSSFRLVPDISFTASPIDAPFAYCTSDETAWSTGQLASCNSGLRDSSSGVLTVAGGTSFDAPSFAGMLALIEQSQNSTGEGVINSTLYSLAAIPNDYSEAFHDITSGGNQCLSGTSYCSTAGASEYAAVAGYDQATGLGSIDLYHLLQAWPAASGSTLTETSTTLVAATTAPTSGATDTITINVAEVPLLDTAVGIPTGTVALTVDGVAPTAATTLTLVNGVATYNFSSTDSGAHVIVATYSGDTLNGASTGTVVVNIGSTSGGGSGGTGTATVNVTPAGGYTGSVDLALSTSNTDLQNDACYDISPATITGTTAVAETLTLLTGAENCSSASVRSGKVHAIRGARTVKTASNSMLPITAAAFGCFGLLLVGFAGRRFRQARFLGSLLVLAAFGFTVSGCSNTTSTATQAKSISLSVSPGTITISAGTSGIPTGSYPLTITGTDSVSSSITATTTLTLTID